MSKLKNVNGKKIHDRIRRKMHVIFLLLIVIFCVFLGIAIASDLCMEFREAMYYRMHISKEIRHIISENIEDFYDILITVATILAATVIFFYSVQDNKKEGIPHRAIMAYSFGSYTIPVFFFLSIAILLAGFWFSCFDRKISCIVCITFSFFFQMLSISLILFSTSFSYGLYVICNAESRQYKMLCGIKDDDGTELEGNPQFTWTYLMHHLEQAVTSEELIADKMTLVRKLLKTPFHKRRCWIYKWISGWQKLNISYVDDMSGICLRKNNLIRIYEFYYGNLYAAMEYLNKGENSSDRNKIYLVLYEFLNNLQKLYVKVKKSENKKAEEAAQNYMMTISGLINAVLDGEAPDAEGFCNYVLNNIIKDDEIRTKLIGLYFLAQEYLYRTAKEGRKGGKRIPALYLNQIRDVTGWSMKREYEAIYYDFWRVWMSWATISEERCNEYFENAMKAMYGKECSMVSDIMQSIKKEGESTYENQNYSVNE